MRLAEEGLDGVFTYGLWHVESHCAPQREADYDMGARRIIMRVSPINFGNLCQFSIDVNRLPDKRSVRDKGVLRGSLRASNRMFVCVVNKVSSSWALLSLDILR